MNNQDILYETNPQIREKKAVWRFFESPDINALCADWWKYFAVGIPLNLTKANYEGDIDLLICRPTRNPANKEMDFDTPQYRVFEVKVSTANVLGVPKSLKHGKIKQLEGQMKKLKAFGCPLLYHFELHIFETGFSNLNNYPTPSILESVELKNNFFQSNDFGYIVSALEFIEGVPENRAGKWHRIANIAVPKKYTPSEPFNTLAIQLDKFYKDNQRELHKNSFYGKPVISYCYKCRNLVIPTPEISCSKCGKTLLTD